METSEHDPSAPAPPRKRLTRSRHDRVLGGVCGGLGRYFDIDPVIFRIGFAALLLAGGASLVLYAAAWLLLPEDGANRSIGESWLHHGPRGRWLPITLIVIGAIVLSGNLRVGHHDGGIGFAVAAIVIGALLLRPRHHGPPPPPPPPAPPSAFPPPPPATTGTVDGRPADAGADDTDPLGTPPPRPPLAPPSVPPPPPPPPPPTGPSVTAVALSIILIGAGVMGLLAAADVVSVSVPVFLAGALVLTGLALIGGAWIGRTRGLIVVGILLTIALAASAAVHTSFRGGAGDRRWVPATARELRHTYRLGAGHAVLDLTHLTSLDGTHNVNVSVGAGEFQVIVPARSRVVASGHAGLGQVTLLDRDRGGWDVDNHVAVGDAEAGTLRLHLDVGLGHVQVTRSLVEVPR